MTIESFIQAHLDARIKKRGVLLIHDQQGIYLPVAKALATADVRVIEATGDLLVAREQALEELRRVGEDTTGKAGLVLYVNYPPPLDPREYYEDPFSMVGLAGAVFPDGAGDTYRALCLQFLPEQSGRIEELFASGQLPPFSLINSLRSGASDSAVLQELLGAEGPKEMLAHFLCADESVSKKLKTSAHWIKDFKDLVQRILGLKLEGQKGEFEDLRATLWRYLLFSEFVADLPGELPPQLLTVPHAPATQEPFVRGLCEYLRDNMRFQSSYEEAAEGVTKELGLAAICRDVEDFGELDTFSFEERGFLNRFSKLISDGEYEKAEESVARRQGSFWGQRDATRAAEWRLADLALRLLLELSAIPAMQKPTLEELVGFYEAQFSRIDGLHREAEQVAAEISPLTGPLVDVMAVAREGYHTAADALARSFQRTVVAEGWPAHCRQRAVDVFDLMVEPLWKSGKRVAIFWIDALRYDLALSLESTLARRHKTKIETVCGQLPGVTSIGMAALLPGASKSFEAMRDGDKIVPVVAGRRIDSANARAEALAAHIGVERVRVLDLEDAAAGRLGTSPDAIEILAVKTTDIDSLGENNPGYFLKLIPEILRKIELAVHRLADAGFHHAVLATDHGFCWMQEAGAGESIKKPAGDWPLSKDRCLLGSGSPDNLSVAIESRAAGIRSDLPLYVCPAGLATYTAGVTYFHGGLSPQENLLPVIQVELKAAKTQSGSERVQINLSYRGAATGRVTSLVPSIELAYPASDLFGPPSVRLILQGFDKKGVTVANPAASPMVDPTTGEIHLDRGKAIKIPLRIQEGYEGDITVHAADPSSGFAHATLKLTTDFHH